MAFNNTKTRYGGVTKTFHWLTAALIISLIPLGMIANDLPYATGEELARKALLFSIHKTLGVAVFLVAFARILWAVTQPKPGLLNADRKPEAFLADLVHWLLYASLVLVPLTGWIEHAATSGFAPIWWPFGQSLPFVPKDETLAHVFATLHAVFGKVLIGSVLLHIAGALKHHVIDKDATLRRMWFGRIADPVVPQQTHSRLSQIAASAVYAVAIGLGLTFGMTATSTGEQRPAASLQQVASDWTVTDGQIKIALSQFGNTVQGQFTDWTAAIAFSETPTGGKNGTVETTINIGSLTLGSVTQQALGADFFNVSGFPTAIFTADILPAGDGYIAKGTLTLKGRTVPVDLPFSLAIADDTATMSGTTTLDRRTFGIGETYADESTVGFNVAVSIDLTATR